MSTTHAVYRSTVDTAANAATRLVGFIANWIFLALATYVALTGIVLRILGPGGLNIASGGVFGTTPTLELVNERGTVTLHDPTLSQWLGTTGSGLLWSIVACGVLGAAHRMWRSFVHDNVFTDQNTRALVLCALLFGGLGQFAMILKTNAITHTIGAITPADLDALGLSAPHNWWPMAITGALLFMAAATKRATRMRADVDGLV